MDRVAAACGCKGTRAANEHAVAAVVGNHIAGARCNAADGIARSGHGNEHAAAIVPMGEVPLAATPMKLPWILLAVEPLVKIRTPSRALPEITLRAAMVVPPIVLFVAPVAITTPFGVQPGAQAEGDVISSRRRIRTADGLTQTARAAICNGGNCERGRGQTILQ